MIAAPRDVNVDLMEPLLAPGFHVEHPSKMDRTIRVFAAVRWTKKREIWSLAPGTDVDAHDSEGCSDLRDAQT